MEDEHVLGPGDVTHLLKREPVDAMPNDWIDRHFDTVHLEALEILDVASPDRRELVRRCGDTKRVEPELENPNRLEGAVFATAHRDDAVVIARVLRAILLDNSNQLDAPRFPIDLPALFHVPARAAYALFVDEEIGFRLWHDAT